ncbi:MAG: hypothetical protein GF398_02680 [Chitinivibrionales bacterium]|nr:hypothetical protein [Chitinivibrionales bacterium]
MKSLKIIRFTLRDHTRHKSFYAVLAIGVLLVLTLRGCYEGTYVVNGHRLNSVELAWHISLSAFHVICIASMLIGVMLAMRFVRRDREDGAVIMILSRPVRRIEYVLSRVAGVWLVTALFMFLLHATIFLITLTSAGGVLPGYLGASLIASVNLLFLITLTVLLSLYLPDFVSGLVSIAVVGVSFISDSVQQALQTELGQAVAPGIVDAKIALWRILWPKAAALQFSAAALIRQQAYINPWPLHPAINILIYLTVAGVLLIVRFQREEI